MSSLNQIKQYLTKGDTSSALELLLSQTQQRNSLHKQAILLAARYEKWTEAKRMGILNEETTLNQINLSILELAEQLSAAPIPTSPIASTQKASYRWIGVASLLIALLVLAWIFRGVLFNQKGKLDTNATPNPNVEEATLETNHLANRLLEPALSTWSIDIQPFGATCKMTILELGLAVKDLNTSYLKLKLSVQHSYEGWYPAQLTSDLFLLKKGDLTEKTETDLAVISVEQHETKQLELQFSIPNTAQHLVFLVKDSKGKLVEIPISSKQNKKIGTSRKKLTHI
ncbi:MAG: hypothetical protein HC912_00745 [Saprospiraceae bacterium]|nr:hypothetical protein [Saprospiraceae bacterium]